MMLNIINAIWDVIQRKRNVSKAAPECLTCDCTMETSIEDEIAPSIEEFVELSRPLMKWLCENWHPHVTAIITPTHAELLEAKYGSGEILDYLLD